jgi:DNA-binding transcriptional ArsR family regulator
LELQADSLTNTYVSNKRNVLDNIFDALANEQRRNIVAQLARGPTTTPAIARQYGFTKQALSRHIGLIENAGLIARVRRGRVDNLSLVPAGLDSVTRWVLELKAGWTASLNRLDQILDDVGD